MHNELAHVRVGAEQDEEEVVDLAIIWFSLFEKRKKQQRWSECRHRCKREAL